MTEKPYQAEKENTAPEQETNASENMQGSSIEISRPSEDLSTSLPLGEADPSSAAPHQIMHTSPFGSTCGPIHMPNGSGETIGSKTTGIKGRTIGERVVGISFNPSLDPRVDKVKALFAEAIDIMHKDQDIDQEKLDLLKAAQMDCLRAQMMVVKFLTYKP